MEASSSTQRPLPRIEPNGRPRRWPRTWDWVNQGAERQTAASLWAIAAAWAGLPIALWLAALGVVAGVLAGIFGASQIGLAHTLHVDEGVGVLGAILGGIVGALGGFFLIIVGYIHDPVSLFGALVSGFVVGIITLAVLLIAEPRLLPLRGYRRLSRREKERLYPLLQETGWRMQLSVVPELWMSDSQKPAAWAHMRAIVVTRGLLGDYDASEAGPKPDLDNTALSAILAHELHHWHVGDPVGLSWVWSCFWPVVVLFNAATWARERAGWFGTLGWLLLWPTWVTTKLIVVPLMAKQCREYEYEADARAASLGDEYRLGLRRALDDLKEWEAPRTGWEDALSATHPPIELRQERLEAPRDAQSAQLIAGRVQPIPIPTTPTPRDEPPLTETRPAPRAATSQDAAAKSESKANLDPTVRAPPPAAGSLTETIARLRGVTRTRRAPPGPLVPPVAPPGGNTPVPRTKPDKAPKSAAPTQAPGKATKKATRRKKWTAPRGC